MIVDGTAGGLDQEYVGAPDGLINRGAYLAVGKVADIGVAQLNADQAADLLCQVGIGIAAENLHVFPV